MLSFQILISVMLSILNSLNFFVFDAFPNSLIYSWIVSLKLKRRKSKELGARSLAHNILGVEGHAGAPNETRKNDKHLIIHIDLHKPNNKLVSA
jgi:hypothetical protein